MLCYLCYLQQSKVLLYRNPFHLFNHLNGAMPNLPQCAQQCPHKVLTMYFVLNNVLKMSSQCSNNVLRSVEQCHYTYVTQFRPTQEEVLSSLLCICICVGFLFVFVPDLYLYLCQVCTENFRKRCQISFKQQAFNETVTFKNSENIHCPSSVFCTSFYVTWQIIYTKQGLTASQG